MIIQYILIQLQNRKIHFLFRVFKCTGRTVSGRDVVATTREFIVGGDVDVDIVLVRVVEEELRQADVGRQQRRIKVSQAQRIPRKVKILY